MANLEITTPRTILFSKTDVFFVSIKKNIDVNDKILIWFDNNSTSKPEYWNIERNYDCLDYLSQLDAFPIYAPYSESPDNDVISIAFSLKQDPNVEIPFSTSLTINCRLTSLPDIITTTLYYQSTYNPHSENEDIYNINPNYNIPVSSDGTKQLLRTNPKLTGNVKITIDNNQNVWLNSIDANLELSSNRFKKFKVSSNSTYAYDLRKLFDEGKLDSKTLFTLNEKDSTSLKSNNYEQFNTSYWSGCEYLNSLLYDENFSFLAPLWIDKNVPDYFVVFSSPDVISDNLKSDAENFKNIFIKNSKVVKVFSLKAGTIIGDYIRGIINSTTYKSSPIKVNYENLKSITYRGVDFKNGVYTEKNELIEDLVTEDNPIIFFEDNIIQGFERNDLICYNLLNLEFLFNDKEAYEYDINRYFGFYINENELSKFTIDPEGFSELYSWIPKSKVKVDNESSYDINDNSGITIVSKIDSNSKYPSSELLSEAERIFYVKGKYNLYKIKDTSIKETKVDKLFSKPVSYLTTNQNYLDLSDITGFGSTKFNAKAEIKTDYGFPFDITVNDKFRDSDSISFIYQKGSVQKEWKVIANSYAVSKGETLEEEITKEAQNINISTTLKSVLSYTDFNIGQFEIPDLFNFELGTSIEVEYNNKVLNGYKSTSESVTLTSGNDTFTVSSIEYLYVDQLVTGDGIPSNTYITSINSNNNEITISNDASLSVSSTLTFSAFVIVKGDYSSELTEDDTFEIINLDTRESFVVTLNDNSILNTSSNTFINVVSNDSLSSIILNPNKFSANLDYKNNPTYNKVKVLEISEVTQNTSTYKTFLNVKDESKVIVNSSNLTDNYIFTLRYSYQYIYNYFNPEGSLSESINSIINAFNTFDYKKFTVSKKDSGFLIRSEFEQDALVKIKIDLSNNHTNVSDILVHKVNGIGYLYKYSGSTPLYKKIIINKYNYDTKRYSFLINSLFSRNIAGDEWIKTSNGNKQLKLFPIESISSYYLYNESSDYIELELKENVAPDLDKESNAVFYILHQNSLGVMSFIPIVDLDTDFLDSDYSYLPSEDLKLDFYRFSAEEKLPVNQVYRIFTEYKNNPNFSTILKLYAVKSDGTELLVNTKTVTVDTSTNYICFHTIPALYPLTYYMNPSNVSDISGYYQLDRDIVIGSGKIKTASGGGDQLIEEFATSIGNPNETNIPAGNWNFEQYVSMSSTGGTPSLFAQIYKRSSGGTETLIASNTSNPVSIDQGASKNLYKFSVTVPTTSILTTDRIVIKLYGRNLGSNTMTCHFEDANISKVTTSLPSSTLGNVEITHFYFTYNESIVTSIKPYLQNSKGFNPFENRVIKKTMKIIDAGSKADLTPDSNNDGVSDLFDELDGLEDGMYVSGTGILPNTQIEYISRTYNPFMRLNKPASIYNITTEISFSSFNGQIDAFNQETNINLFQGFNGIVDYIDTFEEIQVKELYKQNSPDRFSFALLRSEYDRLRENYSTNLFNKSRNIPYINKWVMKDSSDCRSNEYRFNTNLAFGVRNFSPDTNIETPSSLLLHTHDWYYISGMPYWYSKAATENDKNYTFSKVLLSDLYETDYDGFSRSFIRGSHIEKYNGQSLNSASKHLYTYIKYDTNLNKSFVFFKGAKFELDVTNPSFYDNWRFSAVLKPKIRTPFSNDTNLDIKLVENKKWKTLTFVIEAFIQSYTFPDEELSLIGLYTLDSAKNISLDISSNIILTNADLQLTSGIIPIPTYTYSNEIDNTSIEFSTLDDLSRQINSTNLQGNFSDIRIFGYGKRSEDTDNSSKDIHMQLYGRNLIDFNPSKIIYSYGTNVAFEFLGLDNYDYLNTNSDFRSFAPPVHSNHTISTSFSFKRSSSYYMKSGLNSLKETIKKLSFASILRVIESKSYTHVFIDTDGTKTETYNYSNFGLKYIQPTTILKKRMLEPNPDTDVPIELSINDIIGYKISETDYDFQLVRYGGDFIPKTKEIIKFIDAESPLFIQEFSSSSKINTRLHTNEANFGKILNLGFHKVANKKILSLADTVYQSSYPLVNETGLDYRDFNIFSSTWDYNFYQLYNDKNISVSVNPLVEPKEIKTSFGSKLVSTPATLSIETFDFSLNKDVTKDFWYEVNNNVVEIHLYPVNMILKLLKTNTLRNNIIYSLSSLRNDSLFTEDFFDEYILQNIVKIYKISSVKLFSRGDRSTQDLFLNTTPQTRQSLSFVEENGLVLDNRIEDVLIKKDINNLSNAQLSLSIIFDKI